MGRKRNPKPTKNKTVKFIHQTQNQEKSMQQLLLLFENYPFNSKHIQFDFIFNRYNSNSYSSGLWKQIWKNMEKMGNVNLHLVRPNDYQYIKTSLRELYHLQPSVIKILVISIVANIFPKIPSKHTNYEYLETHQFSMIRDFLLLVHSYLLPESNLWKDYLNNPSLSNDYARDFFLPLNMKNLSEKWKNTQISKTKSIRDQFMLDCSKEKKEEILTILNIKNSDRTPEQTKILRLFLDILHNKEEHMNIPEDFQSTSNDLTKAFRSEFITEFNGTFPRKLSSGGRILTPHQILFGLPSKSNNIFSAIIHSGDYQKGYIYELNPNCELILTPEQFRQQINEIMKLFFGHANIQLDADGILRYRQTKYESQQIHALIEIFISKKFSNLIIQLDKLIDHEEKGEWKEIVKNCRILFEDFIREILTRKKIKYSPNSTLKPLIKKMRDFKEKLFIFPKWVLEDPFKNYDDYLLGLRFLGDILNPNNHTDNITVSKNEAITIKNTVISNMITLTGFLK